MAAAAAGTPSASDVINNTARISKVIERHHRVVDGLNEINSAVRKRDYLIRIPGLGWLQAMMREQPFLATTASFVAFPLGQMLITSATLPVLVAGSLTTGLFIASNVCLMLAIPHLLKTPRAMLPDAAARAHADIASIEDSAMDLRAKIHYGLPTGNPSSGIDICESKCEALERSYRKLREELWFTGVVSSRD